MFDPVDERGVPATRGIPLAVRIATAIGVFVIFAVGATVIGFSGYGHMWPYQRAERVRLTPGVPTNEGQTAR